MGIEILTAGGTIDKIYYDQKNDYQIGDTIVDQIFQEAGVTVNWRIKSILKKDSLDMSDEDRAIIRDAVISSESSNILITHGTDSMVATASCLKDIPEKTIVLTGSMSPARFRFSDAIFNIGFAVAATQTLPPGVYIAMNGQVFDPDNVVKNVPENRFENIC